MSKSCSQDIFIYLLVVILKFSFQVIFHVVLVMDSVYTGKVRGVEQHTSICLLHLCMIIKVVNVSCCMLFVSIYSSSFSATVR